MKIGYFQWRGTAILISLWSLIIIGIGYLRAPYLSWQYLKTDWATGLTAECGILALIWLIGLGIVACLYDW